MRPISGRMKKKTQNGENKRTQLVLFKSRRFLSAHKRIAEATILIPCDAEQLPNSQNKNTKYKKRSIITMNDNTSKAKVCLFVFRD